MEKGGFIYILTSKSYRVLYTGVTNDLVKRTYQHKHGLIDGFTKKYNVNKLVYYEVFEDIINAISREKQIKSWPRRRKLELINAMNPEWRDLSEDFFDKQ